MARKATGAHPFYSLHRQGMLRVGTCTPIATVGDPAANATATIELAKHGEQAGADLLVFPELNVTSYAIDDLHLQDALIDATETALAAIVAASAKLKPVLLVGAALRRNGRLLQHGWQLRQAPRVVMRSWQRLQTRRSRCRTCSRTTP